MRGYLLRRYLIAVIIGLFTASMVKAEETDKSHTHYLLSINLAPAACVLYPELRKLRQCQEGYAIIVHGLWKEKPVVATKAVPCTEKPPELSPVQQSVLEKIMPDEEMRNKAWQRYGACTGLSAQEYFRVVMSYANKIKLPAFFSEASATDQDFYQDFLSQELKKINPNLPDKGFYFRCQTQQDKTFLTEVRVCYDKLGQFSDCKTFKPNCPNVITLRAVK